MSKQLLVGFIGVVVSMLASANCAEAQVIELTNVNYTAGMGNPPQPPTAKPQGNYTVSPTGRPWRVKIDYGTLSGGSFTPWTGPQPTYVGITPPANGAVTAWAQPNPATVLTPGNIPNGLRCRVQLQSYWGILGWLDQGSEVTLPCP